MLRPTSKRRRNRDSRACFFPAALPTDRFRVQHTKSFGSAVVTSTCVFCIRPGDHFFVSQLLGLRTRVRYPIEPAFLFQQTASPDLLRTRKPRVLQHAMCNRRSVAQLFVASGHCDQEHRFLPMPGATGVVHVGTTTCSPFDGLHAAEPTVSPIFGWRPVMMWKTGLARPCQPRSRVHQGRKQPVCDVCDYPNHFLEVCVFTNPVGFGVLLRQQHLARGGGGKKNPPRRQPLTHEAFGCRLTEPDLLGKLSPEPLCAANQRRLPWSRLVHSTLFGVIMRATSVSRSVL